MTRRPRKPVPVVEFIYLWNLCMPVVDTPTILVVEDDDIVRMLLVDILEELNFKVCEAESWDAAAQFIDERADIALLITDMNLGDRQGRSGVDLAIHARKLRPEVAVLMASGYGDTLELPEGAELLSKPFTLDALRDRVHSMLGLPAAR